VKAVQEKEIAEKHDEPHLSVSQLKMYLRCPLQYFFRYVCELKIPPSGDLTLGKTVHETLGDNYRQRMQSRQDMPVEQLTDLSSDHWEREIEQTLFSDDENPGQMKDDGVGMLTKYCTDIAASVQPVEVERGFFIETGVTDLPLLGYIDLIDEKRVTITLYPITKGISSLFFLKTKNTALA